MTKKELIAALANVNDDTVILFGKNELQFWLATQVYSDIRNNEIFITNSHTDKTIPEYCELLHED